MGFFKSFKTQNTSENIQQKHLSSSSYIWICFKIKCKSLRGGHYLYVNYISQKDTEKLFSKGFNVFRNRYPHKSMISW